MRLTFSRLAVFGGTSASARSSGTAAGSVGLAVPLALSALTFVGSAIGLLAATPPPEFTSWVACLSFGMTVILGGLQIWKSTRPNPPLDKKFVPREELELRFKEVHQQMGVHTKGLESLRAEGNGRHEDNVERLDKLDEKLDRNCKEISREHGELRKDVRHDFKEEINSLDAKQELRYERTVDRVTDLVRGLARAEGRIESGGARS